MTDALVSGYIERHPAAAARSLSRLDEQELQRFIAGLDAELAAPLLDQLTPALAARCLTRLPAGQAAEIVRRMTNEALVVRLRLVEGAPRTAILRALPRTLATRLRFQLRYPEAVIGSLIDAEVPTLTPELRASDAIRLLRRDRRRPDAQIYVVDEARRLKGMVDLRELIAEPDRAPITRILRPAVTVLNARAALHTVEDLPAWLQHDSLPVVDRRGEFQGVLPRSVVLREERSMLAEVSEEQVAVRTRLALAEIFWLAVGALFDRAEPGNRPLEREG